jgi:hypothetical protein
LFKTYLHIFFVLVSTLDKRPLQWKVVYIDEDLNPHNHLLWLHVLIHLSVTVTLKDINIQWCKEISPVAPVMISISAPEARGRMLINGADAIEIRE